MKHLFIILMLFAAQICSQTTQWMLTWEKENPEPDMDKYLIYRDTLNTPPVNDIASVQHPLKEFIDDTPQKGKPYFYWVKAVNSGGQQSNYSLPVSESIPLISFPASFDSIILNNNASVDIDLDLYVSDPIGGTDLINWTNESTQYVDVNINASTKIATITAPAEWTVSENVFFIATDTSGFYDKSKITIFSDSGATPPPEETLNQIIVYPVPYNAKEHFQINGITFTHMTSEYTLKIYTFLGEPVFKEDIDINGDFTWDMKNDYGTNVNPGIYIYRILKNKNLKKSGKLVIIR